MPTSYVPTARGILHEYTALRFEMPKGLAGQKAILISGRAKKVRAWRITYRSNGHLVNGYLVVPRKIPVENLPCVIWNRGGSREFGALTDFHAFAWLGRVASWGYVVIATQYSGNGGSEGKDEFGGADVEDVLNLRKVLATLPFADLGRIGMIGGSRGGMMTYLCMSRVKWIRAAVTVAGAADQVRASRSRKDMKRVFAEMFGGSRAELIKRSAVYWADKMSKTTPLLLMHGTNDWRVSPQESLDLAGKLLALGRHVKLVLFEGDDHNLHGHWDERWRLTRDWLDKYVRDGQRIRLVKGK